MIRRPRPPHPPPHDPHARRHAHIQDRGQPEDTWITEYLIKQHEDIELIRKYMPVPALDLSRSRKRYDEVGDAGILRGFVWGDQAGCWQHAACLNDITELIYAAIDQPDWVHACWKSCSTRNCSSSRR